MHTKAANTCVIEDTDQRVTKALQCTKVEGADCAIKNADSTEVETECANTECATASAECANASVKYVSEIAVGVADDYAEIIGESAACTKVADCAKGADGVHKAADCGTSAADGVIIGDDSTARSSDCAAIDVAFTTEGADFTGGTLESVVTEGVGCSNTRSTDGDGRCVNIGGDISEGAECMGLGSEGAVVECTGEKGAASDEVYTVVVIDFWNA